MYQHGRKTRQPRNRGIFLATAMLVGIVVLISWWIVHKDIGNSTDAKTTVPIVTEVGEDNEEKFQVNERYFTFELPADWKFVEHLSSSAINAYVYQSTKKGGNDRKLMVHVDTMPQSYKLVRMQPLMPNGNKFMLGNVSGNCSSFAGGAQHQGTAPFEAKWENVSFTCDPINANQTIGTGSVDGGIRTQLGGHSYFFYYEDHNIRPDDKILQDALRSFVAR